MAGMDEILNEVEEEVVEDHQEEIGEQEEPAAEAPAETGETQAQVAAETKAPEDVEGIKAAMLAERRKRQEEAAARQALEAELAALKAQEPEKPFLGEEYEQRFTEMQQAFEQRIVAQKLELSEAMARTRHEDFNDKLQVFGEMVQANPTLRDQMLKEVDPAEFAYRAAADHLKVQKLREIGDPDEYQNKLREQIKAEVMAELEASKKAEVEAAIRSKLKGGFSEERSVAGRTSTKKYDGPTPLKSILG